MSTELSVQDEGLAIAALISDKAANAKRASGGGVGAGSGEGGSPAGQPAAGEGVAGGESGGDPGFSRPAPFSKLDPTLHYAMQELYMKVEEGKAAAAALEQLRLAASRVLDLHDGDQIDIITGIITRR